MNTWRELRGLWSKLVIERGSEDVIQRKDCLDHGEDAMSQWWLTNWRNRLVSRIVATRLSGQICFARYVCCR
jgi:hypothetical protein